MTFVVIKSTNLDTFLEDASASLPIMKYEPLYVSMEVSIEATMVDVLVIYYHIL